MRIQIVATDDLQIEELQNEKIMLFNLKKKRRINKDIFEINLQKIDNLRTLANFFEFELKMIDERIYKIEDLEVKFPDRKYYDENYDTWIEETKHENSLDEYGILIEIHKILANEKNKKYIVVRE